MVTRPCDRHKCRPRTRRRQYCGDTLHGRDTPSLGKCSREMEGKGAHHAAGLAQHFAVGHDARAEHRRAVALPEEARLRQPQKPFSKPSGHAGTLQRKRTCSVFSTLHPLARAVFAQTHSLGYPLRSNERMVSHCVSSTTPWQRSSQRGARRNVASVAKGSFTHDICETGGNKAGRSEQWPSSEAQSWATGDVNHAGPEI